MRAETQRHPVTLILALAQALGLACGCSAPGEVWSQASASVDHSPPSARAAADKDSEQELLENYGQAMKKAADLRHAEAAVDFQRLAEGFALVGNRQRAAEALLWQGFCTEKAGRPDKAAAVYRKVAQEYPDTRPAQQARLRLGTLTSKPGGS